MSNKMKLVDLTIRVEVYAEGVIDVKECLASMGIAVTPVSETDPGFAVNRKRLYEDNNTFDFTEENGIINHWPAGEVGSGTIDIVIEVAD
jgi:hypothetical protein